MVNQTGSTYISDSMANVTEIPTANLGFSTMPTAKKLTGAIATTTDNWKQQKGADIAIISGSRSLSQYSGLIFCRARRHRKSRILRWNLDAICQSSRYVIISGFEGHNISGCRRSLLYSLANVIFHLYMVFPVSLEF